MLFPEQQYTSLSTFIMVFGFLLIVVFSILGIISIQSYDVIFQLYNFTFSLLGINISQTLIGTPQVLDFINIVVIPLFAYFGATGGFQQIYGLITGQSQGFALGSTYTYVARILIFIYLIYELIAFVIAGYQFFSAIPIIGQMLALFFIFMIGVNAYTLVLMLRY